MSKKIKTISQAVPSLLTWLVAEICLENAGIQPDASKVNFLVTFANYQFNKSEWFKMGILSKANRGCAGRDYLYAFMKHWIDGKMWEKHQITDDMKQYSEPIPEYKSL